MVFIKYSFVFMTFFLLLFLFCVYCGLHFVFNYLSPKAIHIEQSFKYKIDDEDREDTLELSSSTRADGFYSYLLGHMPIYSKFDETQILNKVIQFKDLEKIYGRDGGIRIRINNREKDLNKGVFIDIYKKSEYNANKSPFMSLKNLQKQRVLKIQNKYKSIKEKIQRLFKKCTRFKK